MLGNQINRSAGALRDDLSAIVHDTQALLEATADESGRAVRRARHDAARSLRHARRAIGKDRVVAGTRRAMVESDAYVRGHAWSLIAAAAAAGLALGLVFNLRR